MRRILVVCIAASFFAACASGPRAPLESLEEAQVSVAKGSDDGRTLALAGWHAWMVRGNAVEAQALADRARLNAPKDPWGWFLGAELASRNLDSRAEAQLWMGAIEAAPKHLLAPIAASRLGRLMGNDPALDEQLEGRAQRLLADGVPGELSARLRGLVRKARGNRGAAAVAEAAAESGILTAASVAGPFSEWHHLSFTTPFAPETAGTIPPSFQDFRGAPLALRPFSMPGGWLSLRSEAPEGDVYYALAVAEVPEGGRYVARLATSSTTSATLFVDGIEAASRDAHTESAVSTAAALEIPKGRHLVVLKWVRGQGAGDVLASLAPADGGPSRIRFRQAVPGDTLGRGVRLVEDESLRLATHPRALATALEREAGLVGAYAAALDALDRDRDEARRLIESALSHAPGAPPLLVRKAELIERDASLPSRIAAARGAAAWEAVLSGDPDHPQALVGAASLLLDAGRNDDASAKLDRAAELSPRSGSIALGRARLAAARGFEARAQTLAAEAASLGETCRGVKLAFDLARRQDAVHSMDQAAESLAFCRGGSRALASLLADRGEGEEALRLARGQLELDPQSITAAFRVADLLVASGQPLEAAAVLLEQEAFWPRNGLLPRRRAELLERGGDVAGARAARELSLSLSGGDLILRRMLAFEEGGDVLADVSRDGLALIRDFMKRPSTFDSPAVILLDFGGVEARADGSYVEKVHVVARILDKRGIDELGEVNLPHGAEVIHLRTIKPNGRILLPEAIAGKDSISLPGLQVGDFVEYEYLVGYQARGPELPGWSPAAFYFRSAGMPMLESVYVVRAEKAAGLEMDVHNGMEGVQVVEDGDWLTATFRRTDVPALVPEPQAPSRKESIPWVRVGAGADESRIFPYFADSLAPKVRRSLEVRDWAREAAAGQKDALGKIRAVYDRAMVDIEGNDRSFRSGASHVLASRRGNRLPLIKAALDDLGIEARFAAIRTFEQDPAPYRFPEPNRFGYMALAVRVDKNAPWIWLDPGVRGMPFGELIPAAQGVTAWILPEPGENRSWRVTTPEGRADGRGREVELRVALAADGELSGTGVERYLGYDAAVALESLEQMDDERRRQVVESSLSRNFRGLTLEELEVVPQVGAVELRYRFRVPGYGRAIGADRMLVDLDFFSANLGRRYLARGSRETALLISQPERTAARVELVLPEGLHVEHGIEAAREHGPFGDYRRAVAVGDHTVGIEETMELSRGRIAPEAYPQFASWAAAVDRAQAMELVLVRTGDRKSVV